MATISVIIPVYNAEKYLGDALESVRKQSFSDWTCICVNDGFTEGSGLVLDGLYILNYTQEELIRVRHHEDLAQNNKIPR